MLAIRTVLHPTDFSEHSSYAFDAAFALARDYGARLLLLHAAPPPHGEPDAEYRETLRAKLRWLQPNGAPVTMESLLQLGDPVTEILGAARERACDVIVMGTHGRTDERSRRMGSVAEQVIAQAPCPVVVVREPLPAPPPDTPARSAGNARVITALNHLLATCQDAEKGYQAAAADVTTAELRQMFESYGRQRADFAAAVLAAIHRLDTPRERKGSFRARIHRGWMNLRAAMEHRDARAVVEECLRGERAALKNYEKVFKMDLPPDVRTILEEQFTQVSEAHSRINGLQAVGVLNGLVATCRDAEKGYLAARAAVVPPEFKEQFFASAKERAHFATELEAQVRMLGDVSAVDGTAVAGLHRGWMGLKATQKHDGTQNVIDECARGERLALKRYAAALKQALPAEARELVEKQQGKLRAALERLTGLPCEEVQAY